MGTIRTIITVACAALVVGGCSRQPAPAPQSLRVFKSSDATITKDGVTPAEGGWRIERAATGSVPLFEVPATALRQTALTYRARLKAEDVRGKAYLEMWVRVPGRGEFFSRGLHQPLQGTSDWASYEIPFFVNEAGVEVDLVKLNVGFEGGGAVWIKDVELLQTPLG